MKIKYIRNGEQEIPLLDSAPVGKRLAAHYNGNNFYAPLVATTAANASPLRVCSGNENFAVGAGSSKQTATLSFSGTASFAAIPANKSIAIAVINFFIFNAF